LHLRPRGSRSGLPAGPGAFPEGSLDFSVGTLPGAPAAGSAAW